MIQEVWDCLVIDACLRVRRIPLGSEALRGTLDEMSFPWVWMLTLVTACSPPARRKPRVSTREIKEDCSRFFLVSIYFQSLTQSVTDIDTVDTD